MLLLLFCFYFSFVLSFASFPAGGQVLDQILSDSLGDLWGGNFERSMGRKSLIVNLAALVGGTGHSGRGHVRRVFKR